jgi:5-methylcytosine-specific restriction endonuclease McrA
MNNATCSAPECEREGKLKRGLCSMHYQRDRMMQAPCSLDGCSNGKVYADTGFCQTHQRRLLKHGDPNVTMKGKAHKVKYTADGLRICKVCDEPKPLSEYHKDSGGTDGYRAQCKPCRNGYMQGYYAENIDSRRDYIRAHVANNLEHVRALDRARYERHKDKRIALATEAVHIRRARMMKAEYEPGITDTSLRKIHGDNCRYCGVVMEFKRGKRGAIKPTRATIEHIMPISKGGTHTWANTTLACHQCNTSKNAKTVDEWIPRNDHITDGHHQVETTA